MTSSEKITVRIADITAEDIKKAKERQGQHTTPGAYMYYNATVTVQSEDWREQYSKDWTREDFYGCPEVKQWLKGAGADDEYLTNSERDWEGFEKYIAYVEGLEDDLPGEVNGEEIWEAFERSATYLDGLEDIADHIKKDFEPDEIVTIE